MKKEEGKEEEVRAAAAAAASKASEEKNSLLFCVTCGLVDARSDANSICFSPLLFLLSATGSEDPETGRKGAVGRNRDEDNNDDADDCGGGSDDSAIDRGLAGSTRAAAPGSRRLPIAISQRGLGRVLFVSPAEIRCVPSIEEKRAGRFE